MVKFEIRHRFNNEILHEGEAESLKQFVEYLVQEGKSLDGASLDGASLGGATNYSCHHDFFAEIIRRQSTQHFTDSEWSLIGKLIIHRWCWDDLKPHKDILEPILIKLEVLGFGEFLQTMKEKYS